MKRKILTFVALMCSLCLSAQSYIKKDKNVHLDISFTAGTTGIGGELGLRLFDVAKIRAGASFMPKFNYDATFRAEMEYGTLMTDDGLETRFQRVAHMLEEFVGQPVDDQIEMTAVPRLNQAKFLVDIMPFKNKDFHFTTGFYLGKSCIAVCENKPKEISTLFAINLYNRMYENNGELAFGISLPLDYWYIMKYYGRAGFPTGKYTKDIVYQEDVWVHDENLDEEYQDYIEHHKGDIIHKAGDTYMMTPSKENTAYAKAYVNVFRPYVGFGYDGKLDKAGKFKLGVDAGVLFWGGSPELIDHNGFDLMNDVEDIGGQVGRYVDFARKAKVFPVLELKLSYCIF